MAAAAAASSPSPSAASSTTHAWRRQLHDVVDPFARAEEEEEKSGDRASLMAMLLEVVAVGPLLHLYGVTPRGETVRAEVANFHPWIHVRPSVTVGGARRDICDGDLADLRALLEDELQSSRAAKTLAKNAPPPSAAAASASATSTPKKGGKLAAPAKKGGRAASPAAPAAAASASSFFGKKAGAKKPTDDEDDEEGAEGGDDEDMDEFDEDEEDDTPVKGACVIAMKLVSKKSLMYYRGDENDTFLQIWLSSPTLCAAAHQILAKNKLTVKACGKATALAPVSAPRTCVMCTLVNPAGNTECSACESPLPPASPAPAPSAAAAAVTSFSCAGEVYGSNVEHYLRFMVAANLIGGGWCEFSRYELVTEPAARRTNCALELKCRWPLPHSKEEHPLRGVPNDMSNLAAATMAPLRALSFDVHTAARADITPDPKVDPIVSIASTVWWFGSVSIPPVRVLFVVKSAVSATLPSLIEWHHNYQLVFCANESELLRRWRDFFVTIDADIVTGYDVAEKDLPYMLSRVEKYASGGSGNHDFGNSASPAKKTKKSPAASTPRTPSTPSTTTHADFSNWTCLGRDSTPSTLKGIQVYTAGWVKSKKRMTATSNQASAYFQMQGRLFFDIQRIVQTTHSLRTYSLQESCAEFLHHTEELLNDDTLSSLLQQSRVALPAPIKSERSAPAAATSSFQAALDRSTKPSASVAASFAAALAPAKKMTAADRKRKRETIEIETQMDLTSPSPPPVASSSAAAAAPAPICPVLPFNSPLQSFQRYAAYCVRQSELPLFLMRDLMILVASLELARTTGINIKDVWTRGQMVRTWSLLLRHCADSDYLVPSQRDNSQAQTMTSSPCLLDCLGGGAIVTKNTTGLYTDPVAVLDFVSLYPSIMIGFNLCYSTIVVREDEGKLISNDQTILTPIHRRFVKPEVRKGVIPQILEYLLAARKQVKTLMGGTADPLLKMILNERQKALKISANACYGFTGSSASRLLLVELAEATINYGSRLLQQSAAWVGERFGSEAEVIYGDTDSLMILMKGKTVAEAMALAHRISDNITASHPRPITFAYEKIYSPFLLQQNKKYAGVKFTSDPAKHDELDVKGMESVRRDTILVVSDLIQRVLSAILVDRDIAKAMTITKKTIYELLSDTYTLYDLIVTKALWRGVDSTQYGMKLAHIEYAEKLRKRYPNRSVVLGQRVSYVFVQGERGVKQWQQTEEPSYVDTHQLALDLDLYVESYVQKPVVRLFCLPGLLGSAEKATKALFTGEHMRSVKKAGPSAQTGLGTYFKKEVGARCAHCKRPITNGGGANGGGASSPSKAPMATASSQKKLAFGKPTPAAAAAAAAKPSTPAALSHGLCESCFSNLDRVLISRVSEYAAREVQMASLAQECHRCQGGGGLQLQEIICTNEDCKTFWSRKKTWRAVNESHDRLKQLDW